MKIVYRPATIYDIQSMSEYISDVLKNPSAARKLEEKILHGISLLKENPLMGRLLSDKYESIKEPYRFIIINKQLVFYEIADEEIEIIRILDGRTDYISHFMNEEI